MEAVLVALAVVLVSFVAVGMMSNPFFLSQIAQRSTRRMKLFFALERPWHRVGALLCATGIVLMAVDVMFYNLYTWGQFWDEVMGDDWSRGLMFYGFWAFAFGAALWWLIEPTLFPLMRWIFTGRK
jgi:hypothetical protein